MVKSHFKHLPVDTIYSLFKSYCMPLYGSLLWDLGSTAMNIFYVAWRKSTRHLFLIFREPHIARYLIIFVMMSQLLPSYVIGMSIL